MWDYILETDTRYGKDWGQQGSTTGHDKMIGSSLIFLTDAESAS
jgi:hypothetical protein